MTSRSSTNGIHRHHPGAVDQINHAVGKYLRHLNMAHGSVGDFDMYELMQCYMKNPESREKINAIVKDHLFSSD